MGTEAVAPTRQRRAMIVLALVAGGVLLFVVAYFAESLHARAIAGCIDLEAGGRAYFLFFEFPLLVIGLWLAGGLPVALLGRRHLGLAIGVGALLASVTVFWFLSGTPGYVRSLLNTPGYQSFPDGSVPCPTGLPAGWPVWLDR